MQIPEYIEFKTIPAPEGGTYEIGLLPSDGMKIYVVIGYRWSTPQRGELQLLETHESLEKAKEAFESVVERYKHLLTFR